MLAGTSQYFAIAGSAVFNPYFAVRTPFVCVSHNSTDLLLRDLELELVSKAALLSAADESALTFLQFLWSLQATLEAVVGIVRIDNVAGLAEHPRRVIVLSHIVLALGTRFDVSLEIYSVDVKSHLEEIGILRAEQTHSPQLVIGPPFVTYVSGIVAEKSRAPDLEFIVQYTVVEVREQIHALD